jgi:hypothetical protein
MDQVTVTLKWPNDQILNVSNCGRFDQASNRNRLTIELYKLVSSFDKLACGYVFRI